MGGAYAPPVRSFAVGVPILVWHIGSEFHGDPLLLDRGPVGGDLGFGFGTVLLVYELDLYPALVLGLLLGLLLLLEGFTGGLVLVTVLGDEGLPLLDLRLGLLLLGGTVFLGDGFQGLLAFVPVLPERSTSCSLDLAICLCRAVAFGSYFSAISNTSGCHPAT